MILSNKIVVTLRFMFTGILCAMMQTSSVSAQPMIGIDSDFTYAMIDQNNNVNQKPLFLLQNRQVGLESKLYLGLQARAIGFLIKTNQQDKFSYLMRFPPDFTGDYGSELLINNVNIGLLANVSSWMALYSELNWDPARTFEGVDEKITVQDPTGAPLVIERGRVVDATRQTVSLKQAYMLFGDLDKYSVYGYLGKFRTPFGLDDTVSPFSANMIFHYFNGLSHGAAVAVYKEGVHLTAALLQGGPQFRTVNSGNYGGDVDNFAISASYENEFVRIGGGVLGGTGYSSDFPIAHFAITGRRNPAWDGHLRLRFNPLTVSGEIVQTFKVWPGTAGTPTQPANFFPASKVTAYALEAKVDVAEDTAVPSAISVSWSEGRQGASGSQWEFNRQLTIGFQAKVQSNIGVYFEFNHLQGFAPLQWMTGFYPPGAPPGTFVLPSKRDVKQNLGLIGITVAL